MPRLQERRDFPVKRVANAGFRVVLVFGVVSYPYCMDGRLLLSSSSQSWRCLHCICQPPRNCAICIPCFRFGQMIISRAGDPYLSLEQKQGIFFASSPPLLSALISCIDSRALPSLGFLNRVDSKSPQQDTNLSFSQSRKMSTVGPWMRAMNRVALTTPESCSDHISHGDGLLPPIPLILILKYVS